MAPIRWFLRFTSETEYVDNFCTAPAIFSAPKRGVLCPTSQSFVHGGYGNSLLPASPPMDLYM